MSRFAPGSEYHRIRKLLGGSHAPPRAEKRRAKNHFSFRQPEGSTMRLLQIFCGLLTIGLMWSDDAAAAGPASYTLAATWLATAGDAANGKVSCVAGGLINNVAMVELYTSPNANEYPILNIYGPPRRIITSFLLTLGASGCKFENLLFDPGHAGAKQDNQ
jgi:hypothetical protein